MKTARHVCTLILATCVGISQKTAGAERWTPRALSSDQYEASPSFSPDGREMFFFRGDPGFRRYSLFASRCVDGSWSKPEIPSFAAPESADESDPAFSTDGRRIYFASSRGDNRPRGEADFDIWFVERDARGAWGEPERMPEPVNSPESELLPRPQPDGSLLFGSSREGGLGGSDIYLAKRHGSTWRVENLGAPVNSTHSEYEAEMSRDGKLLIVVADRGDRSHLYPYRREAAGWIAQPRIVPRLEVFQVGPLLSPRGDRLLFAQADGERSGEMFLLDLVAQPDRRWPPDCAD
jgi:Tol biopolymer transport system component